MLSVPCLRLGQVAAQLCVMLSAQKPVDGHTQRLSLDIQQSDIDGAHGGVNHDAPAAEMAVKAIVKVLPDHLVVQWILSQNHLRKVLQHMRHTVFTRPDRDPRFPEAADPLVCIDTAHNGLKRIIRIRMPAMAQQENIDTLNFHKSNTPLPDFWPLENPLSLWYISSDGRRNSVFDEFCFFSPKGPPFIMEYTDFLAKCISHLIHSA